MNEVQRKRVSDHVGFSVRVFGENYQLAGTLERFGNIYKVVIGDAGYVNFSIGMVHKVKTRPSKLPLIVLH